MNTRKNRYRRHRFAPEIIAQAVWLYHRFSLSFRDIEDLLVERGIIDSYESIRQAQRFLGLHSRVGNLFRYGRHLMSAKHHRMFRNRAFAVWSEVTYA